MNTAAIPQGPGPVPDHVPTELVYNFHQLEPIMTEKPYERLAELVKVAPKIFFSPGFLPRQEPAWHLTNYEDIRFVAQNPQTFSSQGNYRGPRPEVDGESDYDLIPLELDPPHHNLPRALLTPILSPKSVASMEDKIRSLVLELIQQLKDKGTNECEFVEEFARPLPSILFCGLSGLPMERAEELVEWNNNIIKAKSLEEAQEGAQKIGDLLAELIEEVKANPTDSFISKVVNQAEIDDRPMTNKEIFGFTFLLFLGGLDTVTNMLGNIFSYLGDNPDKRDEIVNNPDILPQAVEELIRTHGVIAVHRAVVEDTEVDGVPMKKGERVTLLYPAANFNDSAFENADTVDFNRESNAHFTFGAGPHRCIGSHLARKEINIAVEELLKAFPTIRTKAGDKPVADCLGTYGYHYVPLE
ncbi:MAG: cytochrome P450, partial [Desulfobulbia bacterium]